MAFRKSFTAEEAKKTGDRLGIRWDKFDVEQFRMGMDVELEHGLRDPATNVTGDDPLITGKIALAHLNEIPDYYDRLEKMEKEASLRTVESVTPQKVVFEVNYSNESNDDKVKVSPKKLPTSDIASP